ncbi:MAG: PAS domain-containing protein [Anaerolineales bacterium]|nr:PAS domain-containing protein [Anaerolineales bacterium]
MPALKEFANFISLNVANLAATYDRLQVESSESYALLPADKRVARARQLIKTVAEACKSETPDLLYRLFDGYTLPLATQSGQNQFPAPVAEVECLGQTLTPVVTNLEAGKFLWLMLAEARAAIFRSTVSPVLVDQPEIPAAHKNISIDSQPQETTTTERSVLQTLMDNLPDCIYAKDVESRFILLNKGTAKLLGASSVDKALGKTDFDFLSPEQANQTHAAEQVLMHSRQPLLNHEEQFIDPITRQIRWNLTSKIPFQNNQGEVIGLVGITRDITERKQLEQQVQESLDRRSHHMQISSEIAQQLSSIPTLADLYQRIVNLMQERLGYYHVEIYTLHEEGLVLQEGTGDAGRRLKDAGHIITLTTENSPAVQAVWSGEPVLVPDVSQDPAWQPNPLLRATQAELAIPISLGAEVVGVLDVQSDRVGGLSQEDRLLLEGLAGQLAIAIDNRRAYLAEKEARYQYQQILDGIVDMVLVKGPKSRIVWANKAFRDYYNMTNEQLQELIDAPFNEPDYTQQYIRDDEHVFTTGETLDIPYEPVTRFDREVRMFHTVKSALRDAAGKIIMTVGVSRDITGQKQTETERERLLAEAERRARREQTIRAITERMRTANNLEQLVKITAQELGQQLSAGHALVELGLETGPDMA